MEHQTLEQQVEIKVDATKALEILSPIPAEKFIIGSYQGYRDPSRGCALGLIHMHFNPADAHGDLHGFGIRQLSERFLVERYNIAEDIASVNNEDNINGYTEPVIKDRVIHLLKDMIEAGY